jgi:hypothetical protein
MPQAEVRLPSSHLSVEQVAGAVNLMIAERAAERLGKAPTLRPGEPGVYFYPDTEYSSQGNCQSRSKASATGDLHKSGIC